jgi:AsmA protein
MRALNALRQQLQRFALILLSIRRPLSFAMMLASVGMVLFLPLLLDDSVFRAAYLADLSPDAVTISEPMIINAKPLLTLASGTLSVPPSRSGQARTVEALSALVKHGGARLALTSPIIRLELSPRLLDESEDDQRADAPVDFTSLSPLLVALLDATFESLTIRQGTVALASASGRIDLLTDVSAEVSVKRKTAVRFKGTATLNGEALNFDATFGARIGRQGNAKMPVRAQIQSGLFAVSIDGRLDVSQGLALIGSTVDVSVPNVRSIARWLGHAWPSGPGLKNFAAQGTADWNGQSIVFKKGTFRMDGNEAAGTLSLAFSGLRPAIAGTLALPDANLSLYAFDPRDGTSAANGKLASASSSLIGLLKATRDLTLSLIGALDADVRMSAETVTFGQLQVGRSALSLALRDGEMLMDLADMALPGGGAVSGELSIRGLRTAPDYTARGRIQGAELADFSALLAGTVMALGKGDVMFDLKASGGAGIDVLSRMTGRIEIAMPNGGLATCALRELASLRDGCHSTTLLAPFQAYLAVTNGIISAERVEAMTGYDRARIEGTMDLVTSTMDLKISTTARSAIETTSQTEPQERFAVRDLIVVRGRTDGPQISVRAP